VVWTNVSHELLRQAASFAGRQPLEDPGNVNAVIVRQPLASERVGSIAAAAKRSSSHSTGTS
jgi:hypothetical protein